MYWKEGTVPEPIALSRTPCLVCTLYYIDLSKPMARNQGVKKKALRHRTNIQAPDPSPADGTIPRTKFLFKNFKIFKHPIKSANDLPRCSTGFFRLHDLVAQTQETRVHTHSFYTYGNAKVSEAHIDPYLNSICVKNDYLTLNERTEEREAARGSILSAYIGFNTCTVFRLHAIPVQGFNFFFQSFNPSKPPTVLTSSIFL